MHDQHAIQTVMPAAAVRGTITLPGDKSISHRYALLAALSQGEATLTRYAPGADCASTLRCLTQMGIAVERDGSTVRLEGRGLRGLWMPGEPLECGNSGTTMRMLAGVLAAHPFDAVLTGDASLCRRPMNRVVTPLAKMGATFDTTNDRAPLTVHGTLLNGIDYSPEIPSAQVKSAILLAGLQAQGVTTVYEPAPTRDHTERAFRAFGAQVEVDGLAVSIQGGQQLSAGTYEVPGDISSAVFWAVAAAGLPGSRVELRQVGLNPSRTAVLNLLRRAGADVDVELGHVSAGEPVGRIVVQHKELRPLTIHPVEVPAVIDELPALAALATFGTVVSVTGAAELRTKESDRISALIGGLRALGADADELPDGFVVRGNGPLQGGTADACDDHRLAMAFAIAALGGRDASTITGASAVSISYPGFFEVLQELRA